MLFFSRRTKTSFHHSGKQLSSLIRSTNTHNSNKLLVARHFSSNKWDDNGVEGYDEGAQHTHFRQGLRARSIVADKQQWQRTLTEKKFERVRTMGAAAAAEAEKGAEKITYDKDTHVAPMVNHIWSENELKEHLENQTVYEPKTVSDKVLSFLVKDLLYKGFNKISGFNYDDPTVKSCAFRLIILESIAGCPGMVAGIFRHFSSLGFLKRDHGWIHTLLEESQNERMHLLICLKKFEASLLTRAMVIGAQMVVVPTLSFVYMIRPKWMHRFVGYLEETACRTYADLIRIAQTPGTQLHAAWDNEPAPQFAIAYYNLDADATWIEVLHHILADESHHRDVNHTFADIKADEPNPFMVKHIQNMKNWQGGNLAKDSKEDTSTGKKWRA